MQSSQLKGTAKVVSKGGIMVGGYGVVYPHSRVWLW